MDQLFTMQVFVRIVEQGALGRAADDLCVSRATVTMALAELESRLGVRLLNRTTRRLSLTDEGRAYYNDCVRIFKDIAEAEDGLLVTRASPRGRLRVSIAQSFEALGIFPLIAEFMNRHPELGVDVLVTDRAVNLVEEGIDCALRAVDIAADAILVARRLFTVHWVTCASPAYLARRGTPGSIEDLAAHDCIRFVSPSTRRAREWVFAENGTQRTLLPDARLWLTSLDGAVAAARAGSGIAQVPDKLAFNAIMQGELAPVLTAHVAEAVPVSFVYPANRYLPARVRVFAKFLADSYPQEGWWPQIARRLEARENAVE